ncbi:hypothetical protein FN846DRAFT_955808, partial [Sphaerosporella brunnea]
MNTLTRVYNACIYCLTHPFFLTRRITPVAVTDTAACTMCELKAYIYQQCRHRGPAAISQPCQSNRRCWAATDPFELELVLQEQPGFCPDCESWAEETGKPLTPYVPPRVGDVISTRDLALAPLELEATAVGVRTFPNCRLKPLTPPPPVRSSSPPAPDTPTPRNKRRRRYTDGEITPHSSAFRTSYYNDSPILRSDRYDPTLTPIRASQGSLLHTPLASSPPHGQKRSYAAANQSPGDIDDDIPKPRPKKTRSSSRLRGNSSVLNSDAYDDEFDLGK